MANNFYRQFTDDPALTSQAQALPEMRDSGLVQSWGNTSAMQSSGVRGRLRGGCAIKRVATCERSTRARGRFDIKTCSIQPR